MNLTYISDFFTTSVTLSQSNPRKFVERLRLALLLYCLASVNITSLKMSEQLSIAICFITDPILHQNRDNLLLNTYTGGLGWIFFTPGTNNKTESTYISRSCLAATLPSPLTQPSRKKLHFFLHTRYARSSRCYNNIQRLQAFSSITFLRGWCHLCVSLNVLNCCYRH